MSAQAGSQSVSAQLLEQHLETLVRKVEQLALENRTLRARHQQLLVERARLLDQTQQARNRMEAMIERLKALEREA